METKQHGYTLLIAITFQYKTNYKWQYHYNNDLMLAMYDHQPPRMAGNYQLRMDNW